MKYSDDLLVHDIPYLAPIRVFTTRKVQMHLSCLTMHVWTTITPPNLLLHVRYHFRT